MEKKQTPFFPLDPVERCYRRWENLFWGIWKSLRKHDSRIVHRLLLSLKEFDLVNLQGDTLTFRSELFAQNPSNEILINTGMFYKSDKKLPNLRGRKPPWKKFSSAVALITFNTICSELDHLPRYRSPRLIYIKNQLPVICTKLERLGFRLSKTSLDDEYKNWIKLPAKKELALRIGAHLHGLGQDAFQKYLTKGRKNYPDLARALPYLPQMEDI